MLRNAFIGVLFFYFHATLPAQNYRLIDSLTHLVALPATHDSIKVSAHNRLAAQYMRFDMSNAANHVQQSELLTSHFSGSWEDSSSFMRHRAWAMYIKANYNWRLGNTAEALKSYLDALKLYEATQFTRGIADALTGIGNCYNIQEQLEEAAKYYKEAGDVFTRINFTEGIIISYGNTAAIQTKLGKFKISNSLLFKSISLAQNAKIDKYNGELYYNIVSNYIKMDSIPQAKVYAELALKILENSADFNTYADLSMDLSMISFREKNWDKAAEFAQKSLELSQRIKSKAAIRDSYNQLTKIYLQKSIVATQSAAKDSLFLKAFYYNEQLLAWKDTIYNTEKGKQIAEMQVRYETEKKEKEISLLNEAAKNREIELLRSEVDLRQEKLKSERAREQAILFEKNNQNIALQLELNELRINEQQAEASKKQAEIDLLSQENQQKQQQVQQERRLRYALLTGMALLALFVFFLLRLYYQKNQAQRKIERQSAEIEAQNQHLEQANRFKSIFLSNMSHEIRTPLNTIIGVSGLLTEAALPKREAEFANVIQHASKNLLLIINEILDFSKIEAGKIDFHPTVIDLPQTLFRVQSMMGVAAAQKNLELQLITAPELPRWVVTDASRLQQILLNLLSNAIKFTEKGRISLEATPQTPLPDGRTEILFRVTDTGTGIAQDDLPHIFDAFRQAGSDTHLKHDGTGLGLAISRQLVELQGGEIGVHSTPGIGSIFYFTLPVSIAPKHEIHTEPAEPDTRPLPSVQILLVEDNQFNQMLAVELFKKMIKDPQITIAPHGEAALQLVRAKTFDIIFMDIKMPVMDGYAATREMRLAGILTPIIALTANATAEEKEKCTVEGMNDYLSKPIDVKLLREIIRKWAL